jgi:hypothetical protein
MTLSGHPEQDGFEIAKILRVQAGQYSSNQCAAAVARPFNKLSCNSSQMSWHTYCTSLALAAVAVMG